MLRIGYAFILTAGGLLAGYVAYALIRLLVTSPAIGPVFKGVILLGALGLILTLVGLILERRKEKDDVDRDDGNG